MKSARTVIGFFYINMSC